ncbi:hypothetical protein FG147_04600, partial [Thauera sp. UPWRP]
MIPADLAARLRTLTEASFFETEPPVPGLQRAREIQSRLPELVPGQSGRAGLSARTRRRRRAARAPAA